MSGGYRGRRLLLALIDGYRRWLSGRGLLRRVRCTFHHGETCSAYGRRVAAEATSLGEAVTLIRGRLRRCADTALYALPDDALGWGPAYDRSLPAWQGELDAARELPTTRDALVRGRLAVARFRGDVGEVVALSRLPPPGPGHKLVVRRTGLALPWRALVPRAALLGLAVTLVALWSVSLALVLAAVVVVVTTGRAARLRSRLGRLRWQAQAAAITRAARGRGTDERTATEAVGRPATMHG